MANIRLTLREHGLPAVSLANSQKLQLENSGKKKHMVHNYSVTEELSSHEYQNTSS